MTVAAENKRLTAGEIVEKARELMTLLNLHIAGVAVLGLVNLYLLVHMMFAWSAANHQNAAALADQKVALKLAEVAKRPLEGLDEKLVDATTDADKFYQKRLPYAVSEVLAELGSLTKKQGVKLIGVQYADLVPVLPGTPGELREYQMDARLNGDYRPLVLFINSLERDRMFFTIQALTLTGQQAGTVGLRLRLTTYLRPPVGTEMTEKSVADVAADATGTGAEVTAANGGRTR